MLTIKHLTGPLAGSETPIERNHQRVVFGRQLGCEIAFPPEATLVSGRHFALERKASGDWTIDLFGGPFVAVDGRSAEQGQVVRNGSKLELGRLGGPSFEVLVAPDTRLHNYEPTQKQQSFESARSIADAAGRRARLAVLATAVVAIAATAYGVWQYFNRQAAEAAIREQFAATQAKFTAAQTQFAANQAETARISIPAPVREKLIRSVYLVFAENSQKGGLTGIGTAWPVGPHLLGTNAHVAEDRDELPAGAVMKVRSPGADGKTYTVTGVRIHPGHNAWQKLRSADVIGLTDAKGGIARARMLSSAYDVALLEVKEDLPKDQILELATPSQITSIRASQPIATAGYPAENLFNDLPSLIRATPEFHLGNITGLTNFFFLPSDDDHRQLIHDDLPIAGGASGSPVVDNTGRVIGLQSAGNMNPGQIEGQTFRMPSAALLNFAQRADLLRDLLDNKQDQALARDKTYWDEQIAFFKRGIDLLIPSIVDEAKAKPDDLITKIFDQTFKLLGPDKQPKASGGSQRQRATPLTIGNGARYVFVAYGYEQAPLELYLMVGKKIVDSAKGSWYPSIKYRANPDQGKTDIELWVVSSTEKDVSYVLRAYRVDSK